MFVSSDRPPPPEPTVPKSGRPVTATDNEVRRCREHGLVLHGYYGARWRCKKCATEDVTRRHQVVRATLLEEASGSCAICGYDRCHFNLHFHHVDPAQKSHGMSMGSGK